MFINIFEKHLLIFASIFVPDKGQQKSNIKKQQQ